MSWLFWTDAKDEEKCRCNKSASSNSNESSEKPSTLHTPSRRDWNSIVSHQQDWPEYFDPRVLVPTFLLTSGILLALGFHRRYLRRFPEASDIPYTYLRRRSILGMVTRVGDGDNFRIFHTPGGMLAGWGWLRKVPPSRDLKRNTVHIRLAGIDAPELAHFGHPAQPYGKEAHAWLTKRLKGLRIRAYVHRHDQYSRIVATVYAYRYIFFPQDIGLQMLREGLATIYEGKTGVEFGGSERERLYRQAEAAAKRAGKGLWKSRHSPDWESPRDYKIRTTSEDPNDVKGHTKKG